MKANNKKIVVFLAIIFLFVIGGAIFSKKSFKNVERGHESIKQENELQKENKTEISQREENGEVISTIVQQIKSEEAYLIETDYCKLYFPAKWQDNLEVEFNEEGNVVEFYGIVEGRDRQPIFNIVFNESADVKIGTISKGNETIDISWQFVEPNVDGWSTEEADILYAMQEDINYLFGMLERKEGFIKYEE